MQLTRPGNAPGLGRGDLAIPLDILTNSEQVACWLHLSPDKFPQPRESSYPEVSNMAINDIRNNDMMAHLLGGLENGQDIGHYGRLVFVMVGRHFLKDDELVRYLT